ncbi:MAG: rRNA pseudouridine synthase [Firmicutes bacterium]|nr:rRNA pseudouridine synthase [Bacillota bacterium]
MRLQKYLAQAGVASRRKAEELITQGRVRVNGEIAVLGSKVAEGDLVEVDGRPVEIKVKPVYLLLNKPVGVLSTVSDPQGRPKVVDYIPRKYRQYRLFPVGRLDYDTEGLLILTNDGEFTYRLTHPKFHVPKTYLAQVKGLPSPETLKALRFGVRLEDGPTLPAKVRVVKAGKGSSLLELVLTEGRKRQVKRMCSHVGHPVLKLVRIGFGKLTLEGLPPGQVRELTEEEVQDLLALAEKGERQ